MSVWLSVGDSVGSEKFEMVNAALRTIGLAEHEEPVGPHGGLPWTWEIGGYGCFYHLRRVAAYAALDQGLPKPTTDFEEVWRDRVLQRYYRQFRVQRPRSRLRSGLMRERGEPERSPAWIGRSGAPFAHLMHHTAEYGYYLPITLPEIILVYPPQSGWVEPIGIGSSYRLQQECAVLAERLQFPPDIELQELDQLRRRAETFIDHSGWERFALECFACKALLTGADLSLQSGCALTFG